MSDCMQSAAVHQDAAALADAAGETESMLLLSDTPSSSMDLSRLCRVRVPFRV